MSENSYAQFSASSPNPAAAGGQAVALSYFESPLMPGKKMFLCTGLNAKLGVDSCAGMYAAANAGREAPERLFRCRGCSIGALHSGVAAPQSSTLHGRSICSRCNRTDLRLIGGDICVSCKNREYECVKGRNAKGKPPAKHPPLAKRSLCYVEGGVVKRLVRGASASPEELIVALLRDSPGKVMLGRGCGNAKVLKAGGLI